MKSRKRIKKVVSSLSVATLIMSNAAFVHADPVSAVHAAADASAPADVLASSAPGSHAGITVANPGERSSSPLTQEQLDAINKKAKSGLSQAFSKAMQAHADELEKQAHVALQMHDPNEAVNVMVELTGSTLSQMQSKPGVTATAITEAQKSIGAEIQAVKAQITSAVSASALLSKKGVSFKYDYENVFKGFSVDNIKYGDIAYLKSLPGVKSVSLQQTYMPAATEVIEPTYPGGYENKEHNPEHNLTGIANLWKANYHGEGMLISIIDSGVDWQHEEFPDPQDMSKAKVKSGFKYTKKVVAGYNWADRNDDVIPHVEDPSTAGISTTHGVHVAGTAAGSRSGGGQVDGVASEAQIIAEKVFSDRMPGAITEDIVKAIDHSASLGADVMNLSLGATSEQQKDPNDATGIAIRNATDAGHLVVIAAGNASNAYDDNGRHMGEGLTIGQQPDLNKIGNPGVYADALTVAAANNLIMKQVVSFSSSSSPAAFNGSVSGEGLDSWNAFIGSTPLTLVSLGKNGSGAPLIGGANDYKGRTRIPGKVVLVQRGILSFSEKIESAAAAGAKAIIVYNDKPFSQHTAPPPQGHGKIPFMLISYEDGMKLEAAIEAADTAAEFQDKGIKIAINSENEAGAFDNSNPGEPTSFSSWGTNGDLSLKPDIMAPGQAIYSAIRSTKKGVENEYEYMDGTSMATPYTTGSSAVVMQALAAKGFKTGTRNFVQLTKNLLMNTATPAIRDFTDADDSVDRPDYGVEYQPRRQGAGMVRPDLAATSPVVVTGSAGIGSVSLKEITDKTVFTLTATNLTNKAVTYNIRGTAMVDFLSKPGDNSGDNIRDRYLSNHPLSFDQNTITIAPNATVRVKATLDLTASNAVKNAFVEGYIYFTPTDSSVPKLSVPYNGFYGKWDEPKVVDTPNFVDPNGGLWHSGQGSQMGLYFGGYTFPMPLPTSDDLALGDRYYSFSFKPGTFFPIPIYSLIRNARNLKADVVDADHNLVTHVATKDWQWKRDAYTNAETAMVDPDMLWDGTNLGLPVPDGQYYIALTATSISPDGNGDPQAPIYYPVYKDTKAPSINIMKHTNYSDLSDPEVSNDGTYTLHWKVFDDGKTFGSNIIMFVNGSEPWDNYSNNVKKNDDGTYELKVSGLNDGYNVINLQAYDAAGNLSNDASVVIDSEHAKNQILDYTASLNDHGPSMYWSADVKPGESFDIHFDARGDQLDSIKQVVLTNPKDPTSVVGTPVTIPASAWTTTPISSKANLYHVTGHYDVPADMASGKYWVGYYYLKAGQNWTDQDVPSIGIDMYIDDQAPELSVNTGAFTSTGITRAYTVDDNTVSLMLNVSGTDAVNNSRGYSVYAQADDNDIVTMGSEATDLRTASTFRYPIRLTEGTHTIKLTAQDAQGNNNNDDPVTLTADVRISEGKVVLSGGNLAAPVEIPVQTAPKSLYDAAKVVFDLHGDLHVAKDNPTNIRGYVQVQNGVNPAQNDVPDLDPVVLMGKDDGLETGAPHVKATQVYHASSLYPNFFGQNNGDLPADSYYFFGPVTYVDPGDLPPGKTIVRLTAIDVLGRVVTNNMTIVKDPTYPVMEFDGAYLDDTSTASYYTNEDQLEITGHVRDSSGNPYYASLIDQSHGHPEVMRRYTNLFAPDQWQFSQLVNAEGAFFQDGVDDPNTEAKLFTYVPSDAVRSGDQPFSFTADHLNPGHNFFEVTGGRVYPLEDGKYELFNGNHPLALTIDVYRLTGAASSDVQTVQHAADQLTWDAIKGLNGIKDLDRDHVQADLTLPSFDYAASAAVSWSSSNEAAITSKGVVTRQAEDTPVTLTATVTKGNETATATIQVTVTKQDSSAQSAANDLAFLTWDAIRGGNLSVDDVSEALKLPTKGSNGTTITWSSSDPQHITNTGKVYRPLFDMQDAVVDLKATVTKDQGNAVSNTFHLTVLKDTDYEPYAVLRRAKNQLTMKDLLGHNFAQELVTEDLTLPTSFVTPGGQTISVTWTSNNPAVDNDGVVHRPSQQEGGQFVSLDARMEYEVDGKPWWIQNSYWVYVRPEDTSVDPLVSAAKAAIVWDLIKKDNADSTAVTTDLLLPTQGENGTTIAWSSSDKSVISAQGKVVRPAQDTTVKLTATVTYGDYSETKDIVVTVKAKPVENPGGGGDIGGGGGTTPGDPVGSGNPTPTNTRIEAQVTSTDKLEDGKVTTTVVVDKAKLLEALANSEQGVIVTIKSTSASDHVIGSMSGDLIEALKAKNATIVLSTPSGTYSIGAEQLKVDELASSLGSGASGIIISIQVSKPSDQSLHNIDNAAANHHLQLVGSPVEFTITASANGKSIDVDKFGGFVERSIVVPDGTSGDSVGTGAVINPDGTIRPVPTFFFMENGQLHVKLFSMTNSTYVLVKQAEQAAFKDVQAGWAKAAIDDLAGRLVIQGQASNTFNPKGDITRAEFATILVKALGIPMTQTALPFNDVKSQDWFAGAVSAAYGSGLISGLDAHTFAPNKKISRQEAMAMLTRAMKLAGMSTDAPAGNPLAGFSDKGQVSEWAADAVAVMIKNGIFTGDNNHALRPTANISRAETAVIVERLLQKAGLIN